MYDTSIDVYPSTCCHAPTEYLTISTPLHIFSYIVLKFKVVNQKVHFWSIQYTFGVQVTLLELNMTEKDNNSCHSAEADQIDKKFVKRRLEDYFH